MKKTKYIKKKPEERKFTSLNSRRLKAKAKRFEKE